MQNRTLFNTPRTLIAGAIAVALSGAVQAQTAPGTPASPPAATPSATPAPAATSPTRPQARAPSATDASHALKAVRLSKLDDVSIYGADGKKIGEIDEVVVDPRGGKVQYVVVSAGGLMGVGEKRHKVALSDISLFSKSANDNVPSRATMRQASESLPKADKLERNSPFVRADKLIGTDVVDAAGKQIGEIEDLIVDLQTGQVQYALMEFDKAWSPVDKLFAFRMAEFQPAKEDGKLMLGVRKEALENQPSIDRSALDRTDLTDPAWTARLSQVIGTSRTTN